ncbi:uncharacterized protein [Haliotis asinina]|uniref:uncharacterized protein n=1 Tax=Haliotis asinina TaxID=109174 RepID=UPI0035319988
MEILRTTRGGIKLSFEGFTYVKKNASSLAIRWACSNKNAFHCNGKLRTTLAMENPQVIHQHSHPAVEAPPSHGDSCLSIEVRRRGRPREQNSFVDASWRERNRSCEHDSYMACTGRARVGPKHDSLMAYEGKDDEPTTEREGKEDSVLKKGPTISQRSDKKKMNDTTPSVAGASAHEETAVFTKHLIPRGDGLRRDITDMTSSRIILCAQKKLAESAPGVRQQDNGQGLKGENPEVTPSRFIMNARKKVDEPAPGVSQLDDSPGLKGEIVHTTPSSYILGPQEKYAEPAPGVKQPGQLFRRETVDMTTSFLSTSHKHFDKPLAEAVELDITARSGIGSEKIDITPSATQKFGGLGDKVMTPQATPRRDIKRCYISTDQNRNFTVTTVSSSISTVRKTFTGPADGVGLSLETPKGELRKEMTDMTPSIFISPATKEAAKSAPEVMETQGTSRDELRNEKVDMMPSIYILNAQKKAAETIDLSETSSISDKEEEEIYLPMGHEGKNEDDGVEDGYRADILAEEVSRSDGQFRLWRNVGRASTMFDSPSVGRCSIEIPPAIVIVNTPNGVIISKSESGSNGEASVADMILNPARVDICRDEVKEYFHRKYVGTKHSEEFYCSKRIKGKKCFDYEPKTKRTKRNGHQCHEESVKRTLNYPPPSEAKTCLSKEHRGNKGPFEIGLQCEIVEKAEENVPLAKGFKILKPARVDICRDEVKKYLHRKFMRAKHSKEFFCPKRIKGKKYYEYEPKTKRRKRSGNQRLVYQEPVEQNPVYLSPSEAEAYLSSKPGRNKDPSHVGLPWKIVEKGKENVHRAKEFGILNISGSKDIGHFTKTVPTSHERLICKHTDPSEKIDKGLVRTSGKNGRKRRKVVSPEESSGTGEQGDGQGKAEVDGQMYIDEDWTKECLEDDYEFVEQKKDESLVVREHFVVKKEELVQNVVKEEVDEIMVNKEVQQLNVVKEEFDQTVVNKDLVEPNVFEQEVDQTVVNKALVEPNVVEQEVDQTVVNKDLVEPNVVEQEVDQTVVNDTVVNKEQSVVRMHKWVVNFLPDEGQFLLQEIDEEQIMKDETNDTIFSNKALVGQNVVKEEVDQAVVNKPDEDHFVEKGKDEKQFLEQMDGEQFVQEKDKGQFKYEEQEQNVIREESENVIVVDSEVGEANMDKVKKEQYVVHRKEDFVVVLNN